MELGRKIQTGGAVIAGSGALATGIGAFNLHQRNLELQAWKKHSNTIANNYFDLEDEINAIRQAKPANEADEIGKRWTKYKNFERAFNRINEFMKELTKDIDAKKAAHKSTMAGGLKAIILGAVIYGIGGIVSYFSELLSSD